MTSTAVPPSHQYASDRERKTTNKLSLSELSKEKLSKFKAVVASTPGRVIETMHEVYDDFLELDREDNVSISGQMKLSPSDNHVFAQLKSSSVYGEIRPSGVTKMMELFLKANPDATCLADLGMGLGKLALQVFLQYPKLTRVVGVEMMRRRTEYGFAALSKLNSLQSTSTKVFVRSNRKSKKLDKVTLEQEYEKPAAIVHHDKDSKEGRQETKQRQTQRRVQRGRFQLLDDVDSDGDTNMSAAAHASSEIVKRSITFHQGTLLRIKEAFKADFIICEIVVPPSLEFELCEYMSQLKSGAFLVTYANVAEMYERQKLEMPFTLPSLAHGSKAGTICLVTTWTTDRGHSFYLYRRK